MLILAKHYRTFFVGHKIPNIIFLLIFSAMFITSEIPAKKRKFWVKINFGVPYHLPNTSYTSDQQQYDSIKWY